MVSSVGLISDEAETADSPHEQLARATSDADGGDTGGAASAEGEGSSGAGDEGDGGPPGTGTADIPPASTAPATTAPAPTTTTTTARVVPAPAPPATPAPTVAAQPAPSRVDQVLALVNQARAAGPGHCGPIQLESHLTAAAQGHSDDMAARNYFSHDTPEGLDFSDRITAAGYPGFAAAENIAKGQRTAQQVMTDWMNSPGHRTNIENCSYTAIGIGVNTTAWTWTQDF